MKPIRLPVAANNGKDADSKGVAASPKFFSNMFTVARPRKSSISSEPLGCLALLDAGEQSERPRAFPSTGESLPTNVRAQPTVHVHRPRAVLSSPENDELACELQARQGTTSTSSSIAPKAVLSPSDNLPHAPLSSIEDLAPILSSKEILRAVSPPPNDLLNMGARETSVSDEASSCSTSSYPEHTDEPNELTNGPVDNKQNMSVLSAAAKGEKPDPGLTSEGRLEGNGNEENLSTTANRVLKKHIPSSATRGPAKQQLPKPMLKSKSPRVPRPWY